MANRKMDRAANAALICHVGKRCMEEVFKKSFLKEIEIVSFRDGALFIAISSPVYSQEIKMKEEEILEKINLELKNDVVDKIRFKSSRKQGY